MTCYTCYLHPTSEKHPLTQHVEVTGLRRDIDQLESFLTSGDNRTPYTVTGADYSRESASRLTLKAPTIYQDSDLTLPMITTHLNVIGDELRALANLSVPVRGPRPPQV
jgi:hypothetical protein